jgi:hypothetical protein
MKELFELFNWRIKKFLAVRWLRRIYLLTVLFSILGVGVAEWLIGRDSSISVATRLGQGIGIFVAVIILLLYIRILIEFLISIFYIENHLRSIANRESSFEIED